MSALEDVEKTQLVDRCVAAIRRRCDVVPQWAVILGSGLGGVASAIDSKATIPYAELPGFARSSAAGHRGELILGTLEGTAIIAMSGRFHFYEGYRVDQIVFPVEVMATLGAKCLMVSNAAGGVRPDMQVGDLYRLSDVICFWNGYGRHAAPGSQTTAGSPNVRTAVVSVGGGCRGGVFDLDLQRRAVDVARLAGFDLPPGVYAAMTGPSYETRAEYRFLRTMGIDLAGMSTAAEVLAAARMGQRVIGISMVSNVADPDRPQATNHDEVVQAGVEASAKMETLLRGLLNPTAR